jgi:antitoxin (DNA-binding transcriptional repressor) of toxin-antitoxin stability system
MIRLNIHEAKTHLSRYLPLLEAGETIILCKRNVPIAEIKPIEKRRTEPREPGFLKASSRRLMPSKDGSQVRSEVLAGYGDLPAGDRG